MSQHMQNGQPTPAPAAPKSRNVVAIVALALAILGFIFAVIEGAYLLGWILLPIAFVLSIVALAQRGKPKKLAVAALIIAIIGTIAGAMAFMASTVRIVDEAFNESSSQVAEAPEGEAAEPVDVEAVEGEATEEAPVSGEAGTRENPFPLGATIANSNWEVTVNSVELGATDKVLAENPFNEKPADGMAYGLANVTAKYVGEETGTAWEVSIKYVSESGNTAETSMVVTPEELSSAELYPDASETGNVVFTHPEGDAGVLKVSPGVFAEDVFFAVS